MPEIDPNEEIFAGAHVSGVCPQCQTSYHRKADAGHTCACGWAEGAEDAPEVGDGLDTKTIKDLQQIATDEQVALDPKAKKPEIVAAIRAARAHAECEKTPPTE